MDFLDDDEYGELDRWGNRAVLTEPAGVSASIPVVFAEQVARVPDAVAVSFEGRPMTYREFDEASNRLAHLLVGQGAGPGECVALLLERSAVPRRGPAPARARSAAAAARRRRWTGRSVSRTR
jgi:non-ribosomal peptide synthetase component F